MDHPSVAPPWHKLPIDRDGLYDWVGEPGNGLLLYGSVARGSGDSSSDIDLLLLTNRSAAPQHLGPISLARYDEGSLSRLMTRGSIFGRHLAHEGVILDDPTGRLATILASFVEPRSYERTKRIIRSIAEALQHPAPPNFAKGVHRAAAYSARTALYIDSILRGSEHWDADALATDRGYSSFRMLRNTESPQATDELLRIAIDLTSDVVSIASAPDFESAVTLLAREVPEVSSFIAALATVETELEYSALTLPFA